jgi:hypothetical protein
VADLGFVAPLTTGTVFNPMNTPAAGTQTLFDEPGTVMNPPSGSVFTWFAYESSYSYVVTAMEAEKAVATGGVGVTATGGGVTNTGAAGAASTSSGSGSLGGTTKSSAAQSLQLILPARLGLVAVWDLAFFSKSKHSHDYQVLLKQTFCFLGSTAKREQVIGRQRAISVEYLDGYIANRYINPLENTIAC